MMGHFFTFAFAMLVAGFAIVVLVVIFIARLFKRQPSSGGAEESRNEAKMIQEIYDGLSRMEDRIESLETLLLDKERKEK